MTTAARNDVLNQGRLLSARTPALTDHLAQHGALPTLTGRQLLALVEDAGLTGRGGAGFPAWRKLADVAAAATRRTVIVANGAEGEPESRKDAVLLARAPHLVLDGLALVGAALGAGQLHLYAGASALPGVQAALAERPELAVVLTAAPDTYVAGEESAVVRALGGGPALPFDRTSRVTQKGLRGRPTLVHNVETLAHLALVARHGAGWFRSIGPAEDPGTRLITLSGDVARPGVAEVASGTPLSTLLEEAGTGPRRVRAVLVGGYHGGWVPGPELGCTTLSTPSLRRFGASPGAGVVHVLGLHRCGLTAAADIATWLGAQSAQQCGPCLNGLPALAAALTRLASGELSPAAVADIQRLTEVVTGRGSCRHPDGTARFIRSSLTVFGADVQAHLGGTCVASPRGAL